MTQATGAIRVLLADDHAIVRAGIRQLLEHSGDIQIVAEASDGEEAIGFIKKWEDGLPVPKVILLDLKLPKIGGLQVLRTLKLHSIYQHIPVVVLTSSSEERDVYTAYDYGANSYIVKEIDFDKFLDIAVYIENYWCRLNILPRQS